MTADNRYFAPPHEIAGQLGQVVDPGGGFVPGLAPAPVPGALATASPGVALATLAPRELPADGPDEPQKLALAIARLASELLGGPSGSALAPVSLVPATVLTASHVQLPASSGIGPGAVSPPAAGAGTDDTHELALAIERLANQLFAGPSDAPVASVPLVLDPAPTASRTRPDARAAFAPHVAAAPGASGPSATAPADGVSLVPFSDAPGLGTPGFGTPGLGSPGLSSLGGAPDFGTPGFGSPGSSSPSGAPGFGTPGFGTLGFGSPGSSLLGGAPGFGSPGSSSLGGFGTPGFGTPGFGTPGFGTPGFGTPGLGSPGFGSLGGAPGFGTPGLGSASGPPGSGTLASPVLGNSVTEGPQLARPSSDRSAPTTARGGPRVESTGLPGQPRIRDLGGNAFDPYAVRRDFPILEERIHGGKRLVWLDNAATTQKPRAVIDRLSQFYAHENSNIHRAAHVLAARATDAYEAGRESTRRFLNAPSASEIIFVRGATEGINLVAQSWGRRNVAAGDEIVLTHLEHHANIVPWQQLCAATGARLRVAPVDDRGDIILEDYERLLGPRTRLVAFPQVSNALGTVTPAQEIIEIAHRHGALVLLDGAQAVSHMPVDVQKLDCDFYVFSGHKVFAPTGIGAVFGKRAVLEAMPPWQGGGNMIQDVTFERTTYQQPPGRFEAGTGNIADAVGLGTALDYVTRIGIDNIERYEHELLHYAEQRLATVRGLRMIGTPRHKAGVLSFVLDGHRTEDIGGALDKEGIAVRSGHHCAQPILRRFGVETSVRASLAFYNICEDIDALVDALHRLTASG